MIIKQKPKQSSFGFTVVELIVTIGIIAIISAMALPNMGGVIKEYKLRNAARQMVSSLQRVKLRAIKENRDAQIKLQQDAGTGLFYYELFIDANDNDTVDAGEAFERVDLDENLTISSNFANDIFGFTSRGMPSDGNGTITIKLNENRKVEIAINAVGNVRVN